MNTKGTHKVLGVRFLTETTCVLKVERLNFEFIPGQCVNIGLPASAVNREYSTYSGIKDNYLEFLIKIVHGGLVSTALSKLKKGDRISIDGAYGLFTLTQLGDKKRKYTFIGSGTGIAPFHAFVRSYPGLNYQVIHGIKTKDEQYDKKDYDPKRYVACVSREKAGNFHGRVTDYLKQTKIDPNRIYYLCGNSEMINEAYDILREGGVGGSNIITEVFF